MRDLTATVVVTDAEQRGEATEPPSPDDVTRGDFRIIDADSGEVLFVQTKLDANLRRLRRELNSASYLGLKSEARLSGLRNAHRTFGFRPRQPLRRREACSLCHTAADEPGLHDATLVLYPAIAEAFARTAPAAYERQRETVEAEVLPEWRIAGGLWTSGIINNTAALTYHRDASNFPGSWSAMVVVRRHLRGGYLHVPEVRLADGRDLWASCDDGMVLFFCGSDLLHGVTRFAARPGGYRFTLVWYALNNMRQCLPLADEVAFGARRRTERELAGLGDVDVAESDG